MGSQMSSALGGWCDLTIKAELFIVFISFSPAKSGYRCPDGQHKAITAQTNGKMILTDQLVIEDRKGESADI